MKRCTKCGCLKDLEEFYKSKSAKDGRQPRCKECKKKIAEEYNARPETKERNSQLHQLRMMDPGFRKRRKEYSQRPEVKEAAGIRRSNPEYVAYMKAYRQRPEVKTRAKVREARPENIVVRKNYSRTEKFKENQRRYHTSTKGKATTKAYRARPERKATAKLYRERSEVKARLKELARKPERIAAYNATRTSSEFRAREKARKQTPKYKAMAKEYNSRPEVKVHRKAYFEEYYQRPESIRRINEYRMSDRGREVSKRGHQNRRARKWNAFIEAINEKEIFLRDGWICQICKRRVNKRLSWPSPFSASLDHIIPLKKGGTHEAKNVQLAHLRCNLSKCDRAANDQMRMF